MAGTLPDAYRRAPMSPRATAIATASSRPQARRGRWSWRRAASGAATAARRLILVAALLTGLVVHLAGSGPGAAAHSVHGHGQTAAAAESSASQHVPHDDLRDLSGAELDVDTEDHRNACGDARRSGGASGIATPAPAPGITAVSVSRAGSSHCGAPTGVAGGQAPDGVRVLGVQRT